MTCDPSPSLFCPPPWQSMAGRWRGLFLGSRIVPFGGTSIDLDLTARGPAGLSAGGDPAHQGADTCRERRPVLGPREPEGCPEVGWGHAPAGPRATPRCGGACSVLPWGPYTRCSAPSQVLSGEADTGTSAPPNPSAPPAEKVHPAAGRGKRVWGRGGRAFTPYTALTILAPGPVPRRAQGTWPRRHQLLSGAGIW